jgi:hypothetical protein
LGAKKQYPISCELDDLAKVGGNMNLAYWYALLKDYRKRFKKDKLGFIRVPSQVFRFDMGADRKKVWRYNRKLEDKGLIIVDRTARGGRTWIGYKII